MPIFEYHCKKCDKSFEELVAPSQADTFEPECPTCHGKEVSKKFSTIAKPANQNSTAPVAACPSGTCGLAGSPCANGMCGLG